MYFRALRVGILITVALMLTSCDDIQERSEEGIDAAATAVSRGATEVVEQLTPDSDVFLMPLAGDVREIGAGVDEGAHVGRDRRAMDLFSDDARVYPTRAGTVVHASENRDTTSADSYGYVVAIDHGSGLYSIYAHLAPDIRVAVGDAVSTDTLVGLMSDSGCMSPGCGVHLHFAVRRGAEGLSGRAALFTANTPVPVRGELRDR